MSVVVPKILFAQASPKHFDPAQATDEPSLFSLFNQFLQEEGYHTTTLDDDLLSIDALQDISVLVIGVPEYKKDSVDVDAVKDFVAKGGALLLVTDAATMLNPPESLQALTAIADVKFQEYLNYRPTYLQTFHPHAITGNINRIRIGSIASLTLENGANPLAYTKATQEPVMASFQASGGKIVAVGDVGWLQNKYFDQIDNRLLAKNLFQWLSNENPIEIISLIVPETVKLGQSATVILQFRNNYKNKRPSLKWILDSDEGAIINQPTREKHAIPPGKIVTIQWQVRPQKLGEQDLRLVLELGTESICFDHLPLMNCLAPGYFTLQMKDLDGNPKTTVKMGESFSVEGKFHWTSTPPSPEQKYVLTLSNGLIQDSYEPGQGIDRWHLTATKPGEHQITLSFADGEQSLSVLVKVKESRQYQLEEIYAAHVLPLDAEIAERLRQVDPILSTPQVREQPFNIVSTDQFIEELYDGEAEVRISGMLASARREQWSNPNLLDIILEYFVPTFIPNKGAYIPYDPDLASHLANLHINQRRYLEYNLLRSNESGTIQLKQNIAAYLLHEKYGHGFFYTQTRLGQQLAILERHSESEELQALIELIKDSAIIVNEGFATWMELTFLAKLDREIRPSVTARRILLLEEGSGLFSREINSDYFKKFLPRFDSRYREGFEYLDYIGRTFNLGCAVLIFLLATNIELGIKENNDGDLEPFDKDKIRNKLLDPENPDGCSQFRLQAMAELLLANETAVKNLIHAHHCSHNCLHDGCPLVSLITNQFNWRFA